MTIYLARNKDLIFNQQFLFFLVKNVIAVILAGLLVTSILPFISNIIPQLILNGTYQNVFIIALSTFIFFVVYSFVCLNFSIKITRIRGSWGDIKTKLKLLNK